MTPKKNIEETLKNGFPSPSAEQMESAGKRVFERLRSMEVLDSQELVVMPNEGRSRRIFTLAAAAAVVVVSVLIVNSLRSSSPRDTTSDENVKSGDDGMVLTLTDGSRIEMRAQTELVLKRAADGIRVHLNAGSVIVTAAEQGAGHLYVHTKECVVSVVGTVFHVEAAEKGSRVAVIHGEVHVQQGGTVKRLLPGEQVATTPAIPELPVLQEIAWSRHIESHLALLEQIPVIPAPPPAQRTGRPEFEAASIRPNRAGDLNTTRSVLSPGGTYMGTNQPARSLILQAFGIRGIQLTSGPKWIEDYFSGSYDVTARAAGPASRDELMLMLQAFLEERFKLKYHWETRELPVFALVVASKGKLGPDIRETAGETRLNPVRGAAGLMEGTNATMADLASYLSAGPTGRDGRMVLDRTGVTGRFDFKLEWSPEEPPRVPGTDVLIARPPSNAPSLTTALEEQLGLKLESSRGPVQVMVIDSIERPSEN